MSCATHPDARPSEGAVEKNQFGFFLASNGSELFLGGSNGAKYSGDIEFHDVDSSSGFWQITAKATVGSASAATGFDTIIDSGTTIMYAYGVPMHGPRETIETCHSSHDVSSLLTPWQRSSKPLGTPSSPRETTKAPLRSTRPPLTPIRITPFCTRIALLAITHWLNTKMAFQMPKRLPRSTRPTQKAGIAVGLVKMSDSQTCICIFVFVRSLIPRLRQGLGHYPESIESYQTAISTTTSASQRMQCQNALESAQAKIMNLKTMSIDIMKALARAHDIPLPLSSNRDTVCRALMTHPRFGSEPKLRLLLIPVSETAPLTQHELSRGPDVFAQIGALLGCSCTDSVVLHSEDQIALARGKPNGVGIGRLHTSYEAWMDDNAVAARPLNQRACRLLHRPETYGPILVQKTTFIKTDASPFGKSEDILCFERVDEKELLGKEYKALREEWLRVKGRGDDPKIIQVGSGVPTGPPIVLNFGQSEK